MTNQYHELKNLKAEQKEELKNTSSQMWAEMKIYIWSRTSIVLMIMLASLAFYSFVIKAPSANASSGADTNLALSMKTTVSIPSINEIEIEMKKIHPKASRWMWYETVVNSKKIMIQIADLNNGQKIEFYRTLAAGSLTHQYLAGQEKTLWSKRP